MYDEDVLTNWYLMAHVEIGIEINQMDQKSWKLFRVIGLTLLIRYD